MLGGKRTIKKIVDVVGKILVVIALIFIIKKFKDLNINIAEYISSENILLLIILGVIFSFMISIKSYPWIKILNILSGKSIRFRMANRVYCKANLYKYIPGNIFQYVERFEISTQYKEISNGTVMLSIIIETLCSVIASLLVAVSFSSNIVINYCNKYRNIIKFVLAGVFVVIIILVLLKKKIYEVFNRYKYIFNFKMLKIMLFAVLFFATELILQGGMLLIIISHHCGTIIKGNILFEVIGIYSFSWLIGFITPGVSGGIGVREALLIMALNNLISERIILVSVVILRILNIIGDIIAFAISQFIGSTFLRNDNDGIFN